MPHRTLVLVLGALSAIGPFSIDMYLPGFPAIARDLHTDISHVGLSLTSYFLGISFGQLLYGPLMDRFGRKRPLMVGLSIYIAAAVGCAVSPSISFLIAMRLFLALGGCVGVAGARAVVRDLFSGNEAARMLSALVLVFGVAPIVAPTVGGLVASTLGWRFIFLILAVIASLVLAAVIHLFQESKEADTSISLHPASVLRGYLGLFREPLFVTYTIVAAAAAGGFFSYISGSPFVYMNLLGFSATQFGLIYGTNAVGLIVGSQINRRWLRFMDGTSILRIVVAAQCCLAVVLLTWSSMGFAGSMVVLGLIFGVVSGHGFVNPNAMARALQPFTRNAGSAASMMGCLQMVAGAAASGLVSYLHNGTAMPMIWLMAGCSAVGLAALVGGSRVKEKPC